MSKPIYLDHAASTPVAPEVVDAMLPHFTKDFGNPSSVHRWGQHAEASVERARRGMATVLNCAPDEIIFTSCGSESDNLALRGVLLAARTSGRGEHFITSSVEHDAIIHTAKQLRDVYGFELTLLSVDEFGCVAPEAVQAAMRPDTVLVSVMYANNEIGTIEPISEIAAIAHAGGALFHTDAVQAASQLPVDVRALNIDLLSLGAHKFYGPKGVGALYVRSGIALEPVQTGGAHELGRRAGTSNVPLIAGMATALQLTAERREDDVARFSTMRDRLISGILSSVPDSHLTGHPRARLPNNASFRFSGRGWERTIDAPGYGRDRGQFRLSLQDRGPLPIRCVARPWPRSAVGARLITAHSRSQHNGRANRPRAGCIARPCE